MSFETPFVEYLIIGTHTSVWLLLVVMAVLGIPIQSLLDLNLGFALLLLPFAYLLGTLVSTLTAFPLDPFRKRIRDSVFPYEDYKDEIIGHLSPELYAAYGARNHRVRLMGASIFNWLLLGISLLLHAGFTNSSYYIPAIIIPTSLSILSAIAWRALVRRLFKFRKNAIDVIRKESKQSTRSRQSQKNT